MVDKASIHSRNNLKELPQDTNVEYDAADDDSAAMAKLMRETAARDDLLDNVLTESQATAECVSCYDPDVGYCGSNTQCSGALCERCGDILAH